MAKKSEEFENVPPVSDKEHKQIAKKFKRPLQDATDIQLFKELELRFGAFVFLGEQDEADDDELTTVMIHGRKSRCLGLAVALAEMMKP